jgi:hypothetical protein
MMASDRSRNRCGDRCERCPCRPRCRVKVQDRSMIRGRPRCRADSRWVWHTTNLPCIPRHIHTCLCRRFRSRTLKAALSQCLTQCHNSRQHIGRCLLSRQYRRYRSTRRLLARRAPSGWNRRRSQGISRGRFPGCTERTTSTLLATLMTYRPLSERPWRRPRKKHLRHHRHLAPVRQQSQRKKRCLEHRYRKLQHGSLSLSRSNSRRTRI